MSAEPFTGFAFAVELRLPGSDRPLCEAAFCECDGLELRREISALRELGNKDTVRLLPGVESFGRVTLRRGMTSSFDLWGWWERVRRDPGLRATCDVIVLSPDLAQERVRFRLHGCLPARITGPALDATKNEVAIESLEIACETIEVLRPGEKQPDRARDTVVKAQLRELDASFEREINKARWVTVQLNPHELRTSISHELGPSTRLDLTLRFDLEAPQPTRRRGPDDVRRLTERVAYFATPRPARGGGATTRPAVRLAWGTFQFDGHVEALEETIEGFSPDGRPLRAHVALSLGRAQIAPYAFRAP